MRHLGLDIGTKNIVIAYQDKDDVSFIKETNGYFVYPRATKFIENMLGNPAIARSDGTKRPAKWIKIPESEALCVLGADAEELAYAQNATMSRPMAEGSVTSDEQSLTILASIVQGLLEMAENEIGKFDGTVHICYCTTAPAVNKAINMDYHRKVIDMIINGYESKAKIQTSTITESHAIVLKESPDGTGIGISWGAGTVTVSYIKWGTEVYSFCWVGAGDWIDSEVAQRHGYMPGSSTKSKETPTTVSRRKQVIDLTPGAEPEDRVGLDITLHYQILINNVVQGIIQGFQANENAARIDGGVNIYMAGGTCSPKGFEKRVLLALKEKGCPFEVASVTKSQTPLFTVAEGCLAAAALQS